MVEIHGKILAMGALYNETMQSLQVGGTVILAIALSYIATIFL